MIETLIYIITGLFTIGFPLWYIRNERRKSAQAALTLQKATERGLDEPVSLHPYIDPGTCIGAGACVNACPEDKVIGLINGRAALINPSRCIGHGLCAKACPVNAINLVFGTSKRGLDIPTLDGNFESNIPGIYIAGELGGMGLIRNAVTQGRQAVQNIAKSLGEKNSSDKVYHLIIVGAGPAGIAGALQARKERLNCLIIDQEDLGGTLLTYPRQKVVMSQPIELPLYGKITAREFSKEVLLELFTSVCARTGLIVRAGEKVENITRENTYFKVVTNKSEYISQRILLAIGRRGTPRKLGVPGEKSAKVTYRLLEPEKYNNSNILVVGGGDAAVEAALALAEQPGNVVHIAYRRDGFFRLKEANQNRIETAISANRVIAMFNSEVIAIESEHVAIAQNGTNIELPNDLVFIFAGGELPTEFLTKIGIQFSRKFGEK